MDMPHLVGRTVRPSRLALIVLLRLGVSLDTAPRPAARAATPGLPFVEDFADTALRDTSLTNANWSTDEQALVLAWRQAQYGALAPGLTGTNITGEAYDTRSVALGDVDGDGDGDLDAVFGNWNHPTRLHLNDGAGDPSDTLDGSDIGADDDRTASVTLGDVDGDGDLDLLVSNTRVCQRADAGDASDGALAN